MKLKRFVAKDMREASRAVREAFGAEAVILSSRRVDGGVEITAAMDFDKDAHQDVEIHSPPAQASIASVPTPVIAASDQSVPRSAVATQRQDPAAATPETVTHLRRELADLRGLLEGELTQLSWSGLARQQPLQAALLRRLLGLGVSRDIARDIAARIEAGSHLEGVWTEALKELAKRIPVKPSDGNILDQGGVVAVVGATGVGKTTTVAKLAAHFALRHGRDQVGLISTDCFRIGGQEQLDTFGRLTGVPVLVATSRDKMMLAISQLADRRLILIDTAGMSQRDMNLGQQLATFAGDDNRIIQTFLTLSATAQPAITEEVIKAFSAIELAGAIITKTDEAASLGALVSALIRHQLPAAYVGHGQRVPEDIRVASANDLVATALELMEHFGWDQPIPSPSSRAGSNHG